MKFCFFVLLLAAWSCTSFGSFPISISSQIRTVNVFSGAPQPADGTTEKSGGFGDVAANVVSALEIKKLYPEIKVRLLVTSAATRPDPLVPTTDEIMQIILPSLDPKKKGIVQNYGGIDVIFLKTDFTRVLKPAHLIKTALFIKEAVEKLKLEVPRADLNLNFSNYPGSAPIVRINAEFAIGIEEHYGATQIVKSVNTPSPDGKDGIFMHLNSGPESTGFMLNHFVDDSNKNIKIIGEWATNNGVELPSGEFKTLFAYTSEWQATQIYIFACSHIESKMPILLFVKNFSELDTSNLPSNLRIIKVKGMPHSVMSALIHESFLSPLVTGDISWGQALSSTNTSKTFIYESPWWKKGAAARVRMTLSKDLNIPSKELSEMFFTTKSLSEVPREKMKEESQKLYSFLINRPLQSKLDESIKSHLKAWDSVNNTLQIASHFIEMQNNPNLKMNFDLQNDLGATAALEIKRKLDNGTAIEINLSIPHLFLKLAKSKTADCITKLTSLLTSLTPKMKSQKWD